MPYVVTMNAAREEQRAGLESLATFTSLMQRVRNAHPTAGLYEAAELQWWWGVPRSTDNFPQLFWVDAEGRPEAAVITNDFGDGSSALYNDPTIVVTVMPDASPQWVAHVVERGLAHVAEHDIGEVQLEVDQADDVMRDVLFGRGFEVKDDGMIECWLDADDRPAISPLHDRYELLRRSDTTDRPHHMADPRRPNVEERLRQTSLYRPELDLVIFDGNDEVAAYGMFWYDPVTASGIVEPMRTHDDHQQRGLARHLLTTGIDLLAAAGATRISIGYQPGNPASGPLYRSLGFKPHRQTDLMAGPTSAPR